jgi:hypothetical protein
VTAIIVASLAVCILHLLSSLVIAASTEPAVGTESPAGRTIYELARLRSFDEARLPIAIIAAVAVGLLWLVLYLYRRDATDLPRLARIGIVALRCVALGGLLVFFLDIERRTTTEVVHNSQVAILVDASQSMGLSDNDEPAASGAKSRIDAVVGAFANSPLVANLRHTHDVTISRFDEDVQPVVTLPKFQEPAAAGAAEQSGTNPAAMAPHAELRPPASEVVDWQAALQPRGTQTRLGQAVVDQLRFYRESPLAAVVVISDGAQNAGMEPNAAIEAAKAAKVPLYTIGVGSSRAPRNVALRDLVMPSRAFPDDTLNVTGYLQADGYHGRTVDVELKRRKSDEPAGSGVSVASKQVALGADGDLVPFSFELEPTEAGAFVYQLSVKAPADDGNQRDNQRQAEVVVVDRQTRVLLFASGPMRDYQYLRNQLHRDKTMTVDVLLQTAQAGISQDANQILDRFPSTAEELYQYDCIVAFDPDWTALQPEQVELLEKWISDEAGGMIVVAGPIQTAKWVRSTEHAKLRDLYPVAFQQRLTLLDDGQYGGETPWPLSFQRAGREAKFLWLEDTADESEAAWDEFPGVYGYYAVKGEKPGATVYARFSDPEAGLSNERPVYMAGHFYGAGQVFYLGSGEMWRLRSVDPAYFEVLYTKLIRHVCQGRILRGSSRGALLVERDRYELGETVLLRARLTDAQHDPLTVDSVTAQLLRPDGTAESAQLAAESERPGMYAGQITVLQEGTYQVALQVPDAGEEPLTRYLQVRVPDLERTHAERNEALLRNLADQTGGIYYKHFDSSIFGEDDAQPLAELIENRAEVRTIKGASDQEFRRAHMQWLLGIIAGSLFLEWILRRLNRLA